MGIVLVALLTLTLPAVSQPAVGEVADPTGDARFSPTEAPAPDLRSGRVEVSPDRGLLLEVRFAQGTFDRSATYVQFNLNLGAGDGASDPCQQCGNYLVDFNDIGGTSGEAHVRRLGENGRYEIVGAVPVTTAADGIDISVPWSLMPKEVGRLTYRIATGVKRGEHAQSIILDSMPDSDLPRATLEVKGAPQSKQQSIRSRTVSTRDR